MKFPVRSATGRYIGRRRSNSAASAGESAGDGNNNSNGNGGSAGAASARSKRRRRGLPTNSTTEAPAVASSSSASSPPSSAPLSPSDPAGSSSSNNVLVTIDEQGNKTHVTLKVGGKPFLGPASLSTLSSIPTRKRTRSGGANGTADIPLGYDGNTFYCRVCAGVGDVVCCDGCPLVYHAKCIPAGASRLSMEKNDDPWYCPDCIHTKSVLASSSKKSKAANRSRSNSSPLPDRLKSASGAGMSTPASSEEESDSESAVAAAKGNDSDGSLDMAKEEKGEEDDVANVKEEEDNDKGKSIRRVKKEQAEENLDSTRKARKSERRSSKRRSGDDDDNNGDDAMEEDEKKSNVSERTGRPKRAVTSKVKKESADSEDDDDNDESKDDDMEDDDDVKLSSLKSSPSTPSSSKSSSSSNKKRGRLILPSSKVRANMEAAASPSSGSTPSKKKKGEKKDKKDKKSKKRKDKDTKDESASRERSGSFSRDSEEDISISSSLPYSSSGSGVFKATPAFFFFLNENRQKIERSLSRKHRIFNRLPKGYERNELVAKEAAVQWLKLRQSEVRRFMNTSMKDFEQRIIEWKEEKNIRDMLLEDSNLDTEDGMLDASQDDELLTYQNHKRLYLETNVGCKPFKPEPGISHNRVLLELLQDMRFHPVPMFVANRTETEYGQMDFDRITIPYFDVHGPYSTSVGDECLGCIRGWTHFCSVLKRRVPAVEHRAKLQPPLSSLVATRVGLGLRPRALQQAEGTGSEEDAKNLPVFSCREVPEVSIAKRLPSVGWDSLTDPSSRADDIVQFVEETISMKVPEPPRPDFPSRVMDSAKKPMRGALPMRRGQKRLFSSIDGSDAPLVVNKCGRCRTIIQNDTGCIQCRRAQLVINMAKRPPADEKKQKVDKSPPSKSPDSVRPAAKVQTFMCGRVTMKEGTGEFQNPGDVAISNGILRQRWTPFSVLPPHTLESPMPTTKRSTRDGPPGASSNDEEDSASSEGSDDDDDDDTSKDSNSEPELTSETGSRTADDNSSSSSKSREEEPDLEESRGSGHPSRGDRPGSKRLRSARIAEAIASQSEQPLVEEDRQRAAIRYKEEADDLHKRCLGVACCGLLLALMRRDPLLLFASPVTAEGYSLIIKNPMDFGKIRSNVLSGKYGTLGSFVADCRLLCTNALAYNPPGSIYWKTAKELLDTLVLMQKRATKWINLVKDAHAFAWRRAPKGRPLSRESGSDDEPSSSSVEEASFVVEDPFEELRKTDPEAVEMLEDSEWLRNCIASDFMRTRENETAYYGALAVRRTAAAAEAVLAPYPDTGGTFNTVSRRSHLEDEALRKLVDARVAEITDPVQLKDLPSWREEAIVRITRRAQARRLDGMFGSQNGCARCDGNHSDAEIKRLKKNQPSHLGRNRRKNNEAPRVHPSRVTLSTGMGSRTTRDRIQNVLGELHETTDPIRKAKAANEVSVSVRGSGVHGWGLFADQFFKKGDVVAEYIGEYVSMAVTEAREKLYQEQRIQDYQFRLDDQLVIDATMRGGHGRYINHNCSPNCIAKIIPGEAPNEHLKRVIIIAQREIAPREELTYDYQFPLELDLDARIPCNCQSDQCRGFMNWDLPEKGSNSRAFRSQKRGANMRDRIRRLGRPLKSDKGDVDVDEDSD